MEWLNKIEYIDKRGHSISFINVYPDYNLSLCQKYKSWCKSRKEEEWRGSLAHIGIPAASSVVTIHIAGRSGTHKKRRPDPTRDDEGTDDVCPEGTGNLPSERRRYGPFVGTRDVFLNGLPTFGLDCSRSYRSPFYLNGPPPHSIYFHCPLFIRLSPLYSLSIPMGFSPFGVQLFLSIERYLS